MSSRVIEQYRSFLAPLSQVSWDSQHKQSLIEDDNRAHRVYDFDGIAKKYCKKMRGERNMSCDAYYEKDENQAYLIEFKNQEEGQIDRKWIQNKVYDSITTLVMNENTTRECIANKIIVVVVYNNVQKGDRTNQSYTSAAAFDQFGRKMAQLAKRQGLNAYPKKFDLQKYAGVICKEVYTVEKDIFVNEVMNRMFGKNCEG